MPKHAHKYKVGDTIRFISPVVPYDEGKIGTIVYLTRTVVWVYLPKARKHSEGRFPTFLDRRYSWKCGYSEIEPVRPVGKQLFFNFMYE